MTAAKINASRNALAERLRAVLGDKTYGFPYDRLFTGEWGKVVDALMRHLPVTLDGDVQHTRMNDFGRALILLAEYARDCPGEEALVLALLEDLDGPHQGFRLAAQVMIALRVLAAVPRELRQEEVDLWVRVALQIGSGVPDLEAFAQRGYAPSQAIEEGLVTMHKESRASTGDLRVIERMQPLWHATRLQAALRKVSASSAIEKRSVNTRFGL